MNLVKKARDEEMEEDWFVVHSILMRVSRNDGGCFDGNFIYLFNTTNIGITRVNLPFFLTSFFFLFTFLGQNQTQKFN